MLARQQPRSHPPFLFGQAFFLGSAPRRRNLLAQWPTSPAVYDAFRSWLSAANALSERLAFRSTLFCPSSEIREAPDAAGSLGDRPGFSTTHANSRSLALQTDAPMPSVFSRSSQRCSHNSA